MNNRIFGIKNSVGKRRWWEINVRDDGTVVLYRDKDESIVIIDACEAAGVAIELNRIVGGTAYQRLVNAQSEDDC